LVNNFLKNSIYSPPPKLYLSCIYQISPALNQPA
jgi:hypothetical protein